MSESDKVAIEQFQENVKLRRENAELRATIEHLRAVCRLAVSDGHATPYLTHMVDQAMKAHPDPRRVETAEELEALPDGAVYLSDGHGMAEQKQGGVWYAVGSHQPFEPDLPGVVLWTPEGER